MEELERYKVTVITLFFMVICVQSVNAGECRGQEVDSKGRAWIEASRPLSPGSLNYIAARFCRPQSILVQVWKPVGSHKYELIWQIELEPNPAYMGQVQVFEVSTSDKPVLESSYRYGVYSSASFPVDTLFDRTGMMKRVSVYEEDRETASTDHQFTIRGTYIFTDITYPTYFDVWLCQSRECPSEEELLLEYEMSSQTDDTAPAAPPAGAPLRPMDPMQEKQEPEVNNMPPPDSCKADSLHAPQGRIMLAKHTSLRNIIAHAIEYFLCDDTVFHIQVWAPLQEGTWQLIWRKAIMPDVGSGGGTVHRIKLEEEEVLYLKPGYRLALHVPDENKRIPVPSTFVQNQNVVFSEMKKEQFHRCETINFEEVAFPYDFKIRFCSKEDCSDREMIWTGDDPRVVTQLDVLPSVECPLVVPDVYSTTSSVVEFPDDTSQNNTKSDEEDINRTKKEEINLDEKLENRLLEPNTEKSSNRAGRYEISVLTLGAVLLITTLILAPSI